MEKSSTGGFKAASHFQADCGEEREASLHCIEKMGKPACEAFFDRYKACMKAVSEAKKVERRANFWGGGAS